MADRIDNGGPAFPVAAEFFAGGDMATPAFPGMTLRDYFAAQAMQGELASMRDAEGEICGVSLDASDDTLHRLTKHWYRLADAMLRARGGGNG